MKPSATLSTPSTPAPTGPAAPPPTAAEQAALQAALAAHQHRPGGLLPLLHALQDTLGHVPPALVPAIAQAMNRSRAEVHGVLTYYHHFRSAPPGRRVLQVCRAEACQACGGEALLAAAEAEWGVRCGETRADGAATLEAVYCLGLCASSPAVQLDGQLHARLTPQRLLALLAEPGAR